MQASAAVPALLACVCLQVLVVHDMSMAMATVGGLYTAHQPGASSWAVVTSRVVMALKTAGPTAVDTGVCHMMSSGHTFLLTMPHLLSAVPQVDWIFEDGSAPERPPPQHIVFFVRAPLPSQLNPEANSQQQQQQPAADAAVGLGPSAAGCSHMSLVLLHNAGALAHTAHALTVAGRQQKARVPEGGGRALLLHIDPHRHRYSCKCCAGGQEQCAAEYPGECNRGDEAPAPWLAHACPRGTAYRGCTVCPLAQSCCMQSHPAAMLTALGKPCA
jgi:hypothetical protein